MKYGIEGYGLYFACVEIIAGALTNENITFELEHDAEILAHKFKIDQIKTENMMKYMITLKLFENIGGKIFCYKLANRIDSSLIKNPSLLKIKQNIKEDSRRVEIIKEDSSQIRLDKIRLDKIRLEKNKDIVDLKIDDKCQKKQKLDYLENYKHIIDYWDSKDIRKHKLTVTVRNFKKKHCDILKDYTDNEIMKAIDNYKTIYSSDEYYWDHVWSFWDFIARGLDRFVDDAEPLKTFKQNNNKSLSFHDAETERTKKVLENVRVLREQRKKSESPQEREGI